MHLSYNDPESEDYQHFIGFDDYTLKSKSKTYKPNFPVRRALGLVCLIFAVVKIIVWLNS
jgi:hypothetical protein